VCATHQTELIGTCVGESYMSEGVLQSQKTCWCWEQLSSCNTDAVGATDLEEHIIMIMKWIMMKLLTMIPE